MEMFVFFGCLLAQAFRSGSPLNINLTSFFFKGLTGEALNINDLETIDKFAAQNLQNNEKTKSEYSEADFNEFFGQAWTTILSNGEEKPLVPGGANEYVTFSTLDAFTQASLDARFTEADKQMAAIRKGFNMIFPISILSILVPYEVEYRICGPNEINIDRLKKMTEYQGDCSGQEDNQYVKRFWAALESYTEAQKSLYIKFVWGRSKLPPESATGGEKHKVNVFYSGEYSNHDNYFPKAHTCFF